MLSEGGKISHKRFISVIVSIVICFISAWTAIKYPQYITETLRMLLIFVAIMSGVATVAQVASILKGAQPPKDEEDKTD